VEVESTEHGPLLVSYGFVAGPERSPEAYRVALKPSGREPGFRSLENAVRCLLARVAVEEGGFAMHAAGILRDEMVYILAGKSGSGKTTAVSLSRPAASMGDDFAIVLPGDGFWVSFAVPFDNSGRPPADAPPGLHSVAGIFRLFKGEEAGLECPPKASRQASLFACIMSPQLMPDLVNRLMRNVGNYTDRAPYGHLHFRLDPGFWDLLENG
jgi:hypothetical protein